VAALDWNHWKIDDWPKKIAEVRAVTQKPVWVSEAGASSFGAEEVQVFGLKRTAELLLGEVERVHWYSLHDLPSAWTATTRHKEAEGSAYYHHYYMGLLREDCSPKPAAEDFPRGNAQRSSNGQSKVHCLFRSSARASISFLLRRRRLRQVATSSYSSSFRAGEVHFEKACLQACRNKDE